MSARDHTSEYFRTLGVSCHASEAEIREAYYRLARVHHPDSNYGDPDAANRFKRIQFAYEQLSKRAPVEQSKDSEQFPFVAPDSSRATVFQRSLKAFAVVSTLAATLLGLAQLKFPIEASPKVATNTTGQPRAASEAPETAVDVARASVNEESNLRSSGDLQHSDSPTEVPSNRSALPKLSTETSEKAVRGTTTSSAPPPILNREAPGLSVASTNSTGRHEALSNDGGGAQDVGGESNVREEQSKIAQAVYAAPEVGDLVPSGDLESIDSWDAGFELLNDLRDALADRGREGSLRMHEWQANASSHKLDGFSHPIQIDPAGIQRTMPDGMVRHASFRKQPFSLEAEWDRFEAGPDLPAQALSNNKREATVVRKYDSLELPSNDGSHGLSLAKPINSPNQFDFGTGRKPHPASSSFRTDHFAISKSPNTWSMRDGVKSVYNKVPSTRLPIALPQAHADKLSTDRWSGRNPTMRSFSQQAHLGPSSDRRETDDWQPNNGLPSVGSKLPQVSPRRTAATHHKSLDWKPTSSRITVQKTALPPYASKAVSPHAQPRSYKSEAPRSKFAPTQIGR